ncbi:unnamed protein product [Sphagnum troendelagicum]|uniref:Protein kinase domain-containing protein n=1 Tax=Sphagnum troendelagicum TaxID=128251 RepID=A0ABP0TAS2_9BRYO
MNNSAAKQGLGQTSLLLSYASKGDVDAVKQLLDEGASANASDYDGRTALHLAASEGHVPVVELLLQHGVDVNPVDRWGDTPLADSRKYTKGVVSNILESHGGRIEDNKKHGAVFDMDPSAHYEIDRSELEPMEHIPPLSKGPDEEIRVVKWRGTKVAAKTIYLPLTEDPEVFNKLKLQLLMLEQMRHPNIVQFLCAVTRSQPIVIVTEYLPGGKLNDIISKGRIPTRKALSFALDIARGLNYLHEHKDPIIHGNLAPQNLLQNEAGQLKVSDFGLLGSHIRSITSSSSDINACEYFVQMFEGPQNLEGLAPETIAKKRAYEDARPTFSSQSYPRGMKELISDCWDKDPSKRPAFSVIIQRLEEMKPLKDNEQKCQCAIL